MHARANDARSQNLAVYLAAGAALAVREVHKGPSYIEAKAFAQKALSGCGSKPLAGCRYCSASLGVVLMSLHMMPAK